MLGRRNPLDPAAFAVTVVVIDGEMMMTEKQEHTPGFDGSDDLSAAKVDYFYNPEDWECTHDISDQWAIDDWLQDVIPKADVMVVSTLIRGPQVYAARIPIDLDDEGEPGDWETRYFATLEGARAAISRAKGGL